MLKKLSRKSFVTFFKDQCRGNFYINSVIGFAMLMKQMNVTNVLEKMIFVMLYKPVMME